MDKQFEIVSLENPEWNIIGGGISEYNTRQAGDDHGRNLCFVVKTPGGEIVGGVIAATYWDWLYINLMWVQEDLRGQGFGRRLLELAEEEGRQRGARNSYLDTFSFQAPGFYQKLGYKVFGELPEFPAGHTRFFLTKQL